MKKTSAILLMYLLTSIGPAGVSATPDYEYKIMGVVDRINVEFGEIVIDDMLYRLSPNVLVRNEKNKIAKPKRLRQGSKVGANSYGSASTQYIHEIRLLPDNFDLGAISAEDD